MVSRCKTARVLKGQKVCAEDLPHVPLQSSVHFWTVKDLVDGTNKENSLRERGAQVGRIWAAGHSHL